MLTYSSDHNQWKYYSLSGEGAIRKRFLRRTVPRRAVYIRKAVRRYNVDGIHSGEAAYLSRRHSKSQRYLYAEDRVAQRTISTRRTVVEEHGFDMEGGGGEGGFNTEDGSGEGGFNTEGSGGSAVLIRWAVVERAVVKPANEAQVSIIYSESPPISVVSSEQPASTDDDSVPSLPPPMPSLVINQSPAIFFFLDS